SADGRVFISLSHQIDVVSPVVAPRVASTSPPPAATVALPLGSVSVTFDRDMFVGQPTDPRSVLNPANYALTGEGTGAVAVVSVAYDQASRTAVLGFDALAANRYRLEVVPTIQSVEGIPLAGGFASEFTAVADLTQILRLEF